MTRAPGPYSDSDTGVTPLPEWLLRRFRGDFAITLDLLDSRLKMVMQQCSQIRGDVAKLKDITDSDQDKFASLLNATEELQDFLRWQRSVYRFVRIAIYALGAGIVLFAVLQMVSLG